MHETALEIGSEAASDDAAGGTFFVNGHARRWCAGLTVADVANDAADRVATSLNGRFVARARRASTAIARGDQVLVFQPIVGG